jgi:hypothetical protein
MGMRVGLMLRFNAFVPFIPAPKSNSRQAERQTVGRQDEAGIHRDTAGCNAARLATLCPDERMIQDADSLLIVSRVRKFRGVVKNQNRIVGR